MPSPSLDQVILFVVGIVLAATMHFQLQLYDTHDPRIVLAAFLRRLDIQVFGTRLGD